MKESAELILLLSKALKSNKYVHDPDKRVVFFFYPPTSSEWRDYWSNLLDEGSYTYVSLTYRGVGTKVGLRSVSEGIVEVSY